MKIKFMVSLLSCIGLIGCATTHYSKAPSHRGPASTDSAYDERRNALVTKFFDPSTPASSRWIIGAVLNKPGATLPASVSSYDLFQQERLNRHTFTPGFYQGKAFSVPEIQSLGIQPSDFGLDVFFSAIKVCDSSLVSFLMSDSSLGFEDGRKADLLSNLDNASSPLVFAALMGCLPATNYALANARTTPEEVEKAVYATTFHVHPDVLKAILASRKITLSSNEQGQHLLRSAMVDMDEPGGVETIRLLVQAGVNPNVKLDQYWSPAEGLNKVDKGAKNYRAVKAIFDSVK